MSDDGSDLNAIRAASAEFVALAQRAMAGPAAASELGIEGGATPADLGRFVEHVETAVARVSAALQAGDAATAAIAALGLAPTGNDLSQAGLSYRHGSPIAEARKALSEPGQRISRRHRDAIPE